MDAKKIYTKPQLTTVRVELGVFGSYCNHDGHHGGRRGGRRGGHGNTIGDTFGWPFGD